MSQKTYKLLRKFAKARGFSYRMVKIAWDRSSKEEQKKTLPSIRLVLEEAKKNDKTTNNK